MKPENGYYGLSEADNTNRLIGLGLEINKCEEYIKYTVASSIKKDTKKDLMMVNCSRYYDCVKTGKLYIPLTEMPNEP